MEAVCVVKLVIVVGLNDVSIHVGIEIDVHIVSIAATVVVAIVLLVTIVTSHAQLLEIIEERWSIIPIVVIIILVHVRLIVIVATGVTARAILLV